VRKRGRDEPRRPMQPPMLSGTTALRPRQRLLPRS
jgi:hypothetical protein